MVSGCPARLCLAQAALQGKHYIGVRDVRGSSPVIWVTGLMCLIIRPKQVWPLSKARPRVGKGCDEDEGEGEFRGG